MTVDLYPPAERLLTLPDRHGALLAEFDFYPDLELLYIRWHGHMTAAGVVAGAQAALRLHPRPTPHRILTDKSRTTGNWEEAVPWVHYEWLPQALAGGLRAMAGVVSPDPMARPAAEEFLRAVRQQVTFRLFRTPACAWHWLRQQGG